MILTKNNCFTLMPFKTTELPAGFYEVSVKVLDGKNKSSTCFPKDWTKEKVMAKIEESILRGSSVAQPNGRLAIIGMIDEGIAIRSIVDKKSGMVMSAYPDIYVRR